MSSDEGHNDVSGLIDPVRLPLSGLPAELEGLRLLVVSDLHVRRGRWRRRRQERLLEAVAGAEYDLLLLGGDYMNRPGDEAAAHELLGRLVEAARPRLGAVGVWGNHDTYHLRDRVRDLPGLWLLSNEAWADPGWPVTVIGVDCAPDGLGLAWGDLETAVAAASAVEARSEAKEPVVEAVVPGGGARGAEPAEAGEPGSGQRLRILLAHQPDWLPGASRLGVDLVVAGHTHGGQVRLPGCGPLFNATPGWPLRFSSGILGCGRTRAVVSRGLGETYVQGLRLLCPPHAPLITLTRAEEDAARGDEDGCAWPVELLRWW